MKHTKLLLIIVLTGFISCTPKIKDDKSIGVVEEKTYRFLIDKLTTDMKRQFGGNMYQSDKITPVETPDGLTLGIPNSTTYTFARDNSKYVKGDFNNDKKMDLIICANYTEGRGQPIKKYFLFIQKDDTYQYFAECKGDAIVTENCRKAKLLDGVFNLDSISGEMLVGNSIYQGKHETYYLDYSYRCETEKYKLNLTTKELTLVYQSDLLKKNYTTGVYEKIP